MIIYFLGDLPSTARLNSTARVSPTSTYSRRNKPSSSVSPGMIEPSVDKGRLYRSGDGWVFTVKSVGRSLPLGEDELDVYQMLVAAAMNKCT
jgi:hypothetical protein